LDEILFSEINQPIIQQKLIRSRHDALELVIIVLIGVLALSYGIIRNGVTIHILIVGVLIILFGGFVIYVSVIQYFNSKPFAISSDGLYLARFGIIDIIRRKGTLIRWEEISEIIFNLNRVHPVYGIMSITVYWIRFRNGKLACLNVTDIVNQDQLIHVMKSMCEMHKVKYIASEIPPFRRFRKMYNEQF